jgi:hypothetical protein
MDDYVCIMVLSEPGESQADFAARLSRFWTSMLRQRQADFEKVYAETTAFEDYDKRWGRQYLVEDAVVPVLEAEFAQAGIEHEPIDRDEVFSKYEAVPPEWMQIEH